MYIIAKMESKTKALIESVTRHDNTDYCMSGGILHFLPWPEMLTID